jgi:hypothetical protein
MCVPDVFMASNNIMHMCQLGTHWQPVNLAYARPSACMWPDASVFTACTHSVLACRNIVRGCKVYLRNSSLQPAHKTSVTAAALPIVCISCHLIVVLRQSLAVRWFVE